MSGNTSRSNRSLYRDALERSGNRSALDRSSNRSAVDRSTLEKSTNKTKSFSNDRLSRSMTSRGQESIMNDISNTIPMNQSLDTTAMKKGKFLLKYKQMSEEITPRTAVNDFVQAADDDAMTPAIFHQKLSQRPNQSLGGSFTQGKSIINASKALSDISLSSASSIQDSPNHSRRGRRSKINIASETLDPDRDITKPTNRTGDGNLEDDALELSDQARSRRTRRSRSKGAADQTEMDPDRDVSRPTNRTGDPTMNDLSLDLSDDFKHHRQRRRNKMEMSVANFTAMPGARDSNTFVASSTAIGNTLLQDITPSPAPRRLGKRKGVREQVVANDFDDIDFATPAFPAKIRDKTLEMTTGLDTTKPLHLNRQRKRARPQVSSHDFSDLTFEEAKNSSKTPVDDEENKIEEQNVEQGQDLQGDQNDDKTLENIDDDDLNLTETPDNRRAARKGSSGRKTATVANEFEDLDVSKDKSTIRNKTADVNNATFVRESNASYESNTSGRKNMNSTYPVNNTSQGGAGSKNNTYSIHNISSTEQIKVVDKQLATMVEVLADLEKIEKPKSFRNKIVSIPGSGANNSKASASSSPQLERSGISQAGQSPANLSSRLSNANRSAVIADKSAVAADKSAVSADKSAVAADKSAVAADKSAVNVGSQGSGTASFIPSTQDALIAGNSGRKRRGDRQPAAAAMADANDFDLSNFDDVAPLPVLNNDSVPSFLKVTDIEDNDETLTNDASKTMTPKNKTISNDASKTVTPKNKSINKSLSKTRTPQTNITVNKSRTRVETNEEDIGMDEIGQPQQSGSKIPVMIKQRRQTEEEFAPLVNTPSPSSRVLAQQYKQQTEQEHERSILDEKRQRNAARKSLGTGILLKKPELSNIAESSELPSGLQRRSSSKGTSGQQETTIAEEQQPDYEQDKTLTEQLADQNNDQTRTNIRRSSRKSIYQAGYSTEPGHMETTGVFSPNVESTRIGAMMNLTTVESPIEPSQPREQLRLITPGVTEQVSSRVNTSTPEAARSIHRSVTKNNQNASQPSSASKKSPEASKTLANSRVQDKSLQKSNLSARSLVENESVNTTVQKSQSLHNSVQKSQSVNTSEARDIVNSLNSSERASRHAGPRGMSVTLGAGGKQVLNKPAAVDLRRKSFHHLAANASSGEQPAFGTPEYIRRAKRLSSLGVPAVHSLYQSKLTTSMIAEGGTQTSPAMSLLQDTNDLIESILVRNKNVLMSTTSCQVTPGLKDHTIRSLTSENFRLQETLRFSLGQNDRQSPDVDLTANLINAETSKYQSRKSQRLSTLIETTGIQENGGETTANQADASVAARQSESVSGNHSVSIARQSDSVAHMSMQARANHTQTFLPDLTDTSWISSKGSTVSKAAAGPENQSIQNTLDVIPESNENFSWRHATLTNTLNKDSLVEAHRTINNDLTRKSINANDMTRKSVAPTEELEEIAKLNQTDVQEFRDKFQMLEIREEECIKTLESTDKPEIAQRELEIIKMSKELLREIITTGKIPQDIVRDKSVNDNEEIDDEHVDAENVNNGSRAAIKHKSATEDNGAERVQLSTNGLQLFGDQIDQQDDIQNDYQDKSSIISADDEKDNSEHENDNEQENDEIIDDNVATEDDENVDDYAQVDTVEERDVDQNEVEDVQETIENIRSFINKDKTIDNEENNGEEIGDDVDNDDGNEMLDQEEVTEEVEQVDSQKVGNTSRVNLLNRSELEASVGRDQTSLRLKANLSQTSGDVRVLPSTKERKELRQATLERYFGGEKGGSENTLDNLSFLDTPAKKNATPKEKVARPLKEKKPKAKAETIFPLKDVKFMFQKQSRFKLMKEAEKDLLSGSDKFTKMILKRCTEIARSRGDNKIRLSDMRQAAGETGMFPTVEEDPKNMEWNRRIFETKNTEYHGLVPMLYGGEYIPPRNIYEPKIIGKKRRLSLLKKSSSANMIKRQKVSRDLHASTVQVDDEVQLNFQSPELQRPSQKSVAAKKRGRKSTTGSSKSRKSSDDSSKSRKTSASSAQSRKDSRDSSQDSRKSSVDSRISRKTAQKANKRSRKSTSSQESREATKKPRKSSNSTNRSVTRESPVSQNTTNERSSQEESRDSHFAPSRTITTPVVVKPKGKGRQIKEKAGRNSKATKQANEKESQSKNINVNEKVNQVKVSKSMKNRKK